VSESRFDQRVTYEYELRNGSKMTLRYMSDRQREQFIKGQGQAVMLQGKELLMTHPALDWGTYQKYLANLYLILQGITANKETRDIAGRFEEIEFWLDALVLAGWIFSREQIAQYGDDEEGEPTETIPTPEDVDKLTDAQVTRLGES
jgi:hypothetical protein